MVGNPLPVLADGLVTLPIKPREILARWNEIQELKTSLLNPKEDIVLITDKPFVKNSGCRKLRFAFNLSNEIVREEREENNGVTIWRIWSKVKAPNGRESVDVASASSDERKFAHPGHDVYALCHTRALNRATLGILGLGEISFEEMPPPNDPEQQQESDEPPDDSHHQVAWEPWVPVGIEQVDKPGLKQIILIDGKRTIGVVNALADGTEVSLVPSKPLPVDSRPVQGFLLSKVLESFKAKHPGFDYQLAVRESMLLYVLVRGKLEDSQVKELANAAKWAFSKATESPS